MSSIGFVNNLASFKRTIAYEKARVRGEATKVYKGFVKAMLTDLAKNTPQWSGDLAASWEVVVGAGGQPTAYHQTPFKSNPIEYPAPYFKGSMEAVKYALYVNSFAIDTLTWNNIVSIVNVNPTVKAIGNGVENTNRALPGKKRTSLRPGNYIPGDIMAVNFVAHKWAHRRGHGDLNLGTSNEP